MTLPPCRIVEGGFATHRPRGCGLKTANLPIGESKGGLKSAATI